MAADETQHSDPALLAKLMETDASTGPGWEPGDFGAMLRHQLTAPVPFELGVQAPAVAARLKARAEAQGLLLKNLDDLFHHPNPPIELLEMTKDFAKAISAHPNASIPPEVAAVLYYASIVVAELRCGRRITMLSDALLIDGLKFVLSNDWLDERTRAILQEGVDFLQRSSGGGP